MLFTRTYTNLTHIHINNLIVIYKFVLQQSLTVQDFLTLLVHFFPNQAKFRLYFGGLHIML